MPNHHVNQIPLSEWRKMEEVEKQGLIKITWEEGVGLCSTSYMNFVENPLRRGPKRVKVTNEEEETIPYLLQSSNSPMPSGLWQKFFMKGNV